VLTFVVSPYSSAFNPQFYKLVSIGRYVRYTLSLHSRSWPFPLLSQILETERYWSYRSTFPFTFFKTVHPLLALIRQEPYSPDIFPSHTELT
jgi:hypothetical protein